MYTLLLNYVIRPSLFATGFLIFALIFAYEVWHKTQYINPLWFILTFIVLYDACVAAYYFWKEKRCSRKLKMDHLNKAEKDD